VVRYRIPADKVGLLPEALKVREGVAEVKVKSYAVLPDGTHIIEVEEPIEALKEYELK